MFSLLLLLFIGNVNSFLHEKDYQNKFSDFLNKYHKSYSPPEYKIRYNIFKDNLDLISKHNSQNHSWTLGMNKFGDMTWHEVRTQCFQIPPSPQLNMWNGKYTSFSTDNLPDSIDWVSKGAVTPVKNQKQCGSCWSFSTTGSVEGLNFLRTGKLISLSEQQLVDCSTPFGNNGCQGGLMDDAFEYIQKYGICKEKDYPYTASNNECHTCDSAVHINGFKDVTKKDENQLKAAVSKQPISVGIEADKLGFQFYSGGIFNGTCGTNLDHGVLVVGYGVESGKEYWKIKNSWGGSWGDRGYINIARNVKDNSGLCGVTLMASYPT